MPRDESVGKSEARRPTDPARLVHGYGGIEHTQPGPFEDCLLCKLEAIAAAWFEFRQGDLDHLLHEYRKDDDGD